MRPKGARIGGKAKKKRVLWSLVVVEGLDGIENSIERMRSRKRFEVQLSSQTGGTGAQDGPWQKGRRFMTQRDSHHTARPNIATRMAALEFLVGTQTSAKDLRPPLVKLHRRAGANRSMNTYPALKPCSDILNRTGILNLKFSKRVG
jgi:hypothetical protein